MGRFLKRIALFGGFAFSFYLLLIIIYGSFIPKGLRKNLPYSKGGYGFLHSRLIEAETVKDIDVLVLGSSHAYRGYDPRIFAKVGLNMYNLGSSAQTFIQTEQVLKRYIDKMNPKLIIFDVYPFVFNSDGIESTVDFLSNSKVNKSLVISSLETGNIKVYNTLVFSLYENLFSLNNTFKEKRKTKRDTYIPGGFVENQTVMKSEEIYKPHQYIIAPDQWNAFIRIIGFLESRHLKYVLIQSPFLKDKYKAINNNAYMDSIFSSISAYYNYNERYSWDKPYFFDDVHLNQKGVDIFDSLLIDDLKEKKYCN